MLLELDGQRAAAASRDTWGKAFDLLAVEPPCCAVRVVGDAVATATCDEGRDAWVSLGDCIAAILHGGGRPN